jgi:hypothetical protein
MEPPMKKTGHAKVVVELAKSTGIAEPDVEKVLNALGLKRIQTEAAKANQGRELGAASAKIGFKIGRSTIIV